ncbi:hypothetical protein M1N10_04050 [Thermodesulfovibrionales bacterium]|nr:hypothetical protein [Thermodesulfovibrionales bacterium]MCL0038169.1 hypothetical protein [Thermodesulfovibrionales bacterium]
MIRPLKLIKETRKTAILKPPAFDCLKGAPAINITKGCANLCVYCYARGFRYAPPKGEVHLYEGLSEKLEQELTKRRRLPLWVSFSTASDAFQAVDEILEATYRVMKILLERGIGVSFLTKGFIPSEFIELFRRHHKRIKARIGIVSLCDDYAKLFEPFSSSPLTRLSCAKNLIDAGVDTSVRIDPVVPKVTGSEESIGELIKGLKWAGVKKISVSSLVMRPALLNQFFAELPPSLAKDILRYYSGQPWQVVITSAKTKLLPMAMRISCYRAFADLANSCGIESSICGCKNPDLPWQCCNPWIDAKDLLSRSQMSLF